MLKGVVVIVVEDLFRFVFVVAIFDNDDDTFEEVDGGVDVVDDEDEVADIVNIVVVSLQLITMMIMIINQDKSPQ